MQELFDGATQIGRAKLLETLKSESASRGTEHISLYFKKLTPDIVDKIKKEISLTESIKSKATKLAVKESLISIMSMLKIIPTGAGAVFSHKKDAYYISLPETLAWDYYRCDKSFHLDPLLNYNELKWGLIVMDTKQYAIGLVVNSRIIVLKTEDVYVAGKIKAGGQSAQRFEESRRKELQYYLAKLSDTVESVLGPHNVEKILLGGVYPTMDLFYRNNSMKAQFRDILEAPVSVTYSNEAGLEQLLEKQKEKFEVALKAYFREAEGLDRFVLGRSKGNVYRLQQLVGSHVEKIVSGYMLLGTDPSYYYCSSDKVILDKLCEHSNNCCKRILDCFNAIPYYTFNSLSSCGMQMSKLLKRSGVALEVVN